MKKLLQQIFGVKEYLAEQKKQTEILEKILEHNKAQTHYLKGYLEFKGLVR